MLSARRVQKNRYFFKPTTDKVSFVGKHTIQRLKERHDLTFTPAQWDAILSDIKNKKALLISITPNGLEIWVTKVDDKILRLIYDPKGPFFVTVQPNTKTKLRQR